MDKAIVRLSTFLQGKGPWSIGAIAGLAGGFFEVGWIALYQKLNGHESVAVARGVTQSLFPEFVTAPASVPLGVVIHMALAVLLGVVIAFVVNRMLPRIVGTVMEPVVVIVMLVGVWATNFFVALPAINPNFVLLVPYEAGLASKILFGSAAAFVFWSAHRPRVAQKPGH
jgi:hypothetical protein